MFYFTADLHLGHKNVIRFCDRPFQSADEMDAKIINNINEMVMHEDHLYILGDFTMQGVGVAEKYLDRIHSRNVFIVPGGHDKKWIKQYNKQAPLPGVTILPDLIHISYKQQIIVLCHYAMRVWDRSHYGTWHLFGHSHGRLPSHGLSYDVGGDNNGFYPLSFDEIKKKMECLQIALDGDRLDKETREKLK